MGLPTRARKTDQNRLNAHDFFAIEVRPIEINLAHSGGAPRGVERLFMMAALIPPCDRASRLGAVRGYSNVVRGHLARRCKCPVRTPG